MSDRDDRKGEIAAYLIGALEGPELECFEGEVRRDPALELEIRKLRGTSARLAEIAPPFEMPAGLGDRVRVAIAADSGAATAPEAEADSGRVADEIAVPAAPEPADLAPSEPAIEPDPKPAMYDELPPRATARPLKRRWRWPARLVAVGAVAASIAAVVIVGSRLIDDASGDLEITGGLTSQRSDATVASVEVRATGIGRVIELRSDNLPILPTGEYYELWFVGPGDSKSDPNRISAGTFHPDEDGNSNVELKAAVDPERFPVIEITSEPGDGNPASSGDVVAKLNSRS